MIDRPGFHGKAEPTATRTDMDCHWGPRGRSDQFGSCPCLSFSGMERSGAVAWVRGQGPCQGVAALISAWSWVHMSAAICEDWYVVGAC